MRTGPYERLEERDDIEAALLEGHDAEEWEVIPNLDTFFTRVYEYYRGKGFTAIVLSRVVNLCILAFTIVFTTVLTVYVDWGAILTHCVSEATCEQVHAWRDAPFTQVSWPVAVLVVLYQLIFGAYWLYLTMRLFYEVRELADTRRVFRDRLGISERRLQTMRWDEVVARLIDLQRRTRFCIVKDELSEEDIVNRIMRRENYLIALINRGVLNLNLRVPFPLSLLLPSSAPPPLPSRVQRSHGDDSDDSEDGDDSAHATTAATPHLTKTLEWGLYITCLNTMFDEHFSIRQAFLHNPARLRRRFVVLGAIMFVLSPFIVAFMCVYFFLQYAEQFKSQPTRVSARSWTPFARWTFREFNELPHIFEARMRASHAPADTYIRLFPNPLLSTLARLVAFVAGAIAAIIIVLSLVDESILLYYTIAGRNGLWYLAICTTVLAVARAFITDEAAAGEPLPEETLRAVAAHTHHLPRRWRNRAHTHEVSEEVASMYQFKVVLFVRELVSVVTAPFVLAISLASSADRIVAFMRDFTVLVDGVGHVCSFATFDLDKHGDVRFGAGDASTTTRLPPRVRTRAGKLEKSILNFRAHYPNWRDRSHRGERLVANLNQFTMQHSMLAAAPTPTPTDAHAASMFGGASLRVSVHRPGLAASSAALAGTPHSPAHNQFYWMDRYYDSCDDGGSPSTATSATLPAGSALAPFDGIEGAGTGAEK